MASHSTHSIEAVTVSAYTIPTDAPEADGTLRWNSTTLILAELRCGGTIGLGYTYGNRATAVMADDLGEVCLLQQTPMDIPRLHAAMLREVRNDGNSGISAMALSALDVALWDLKAKMLNCSVLDLLGGADSSTSVAVYGSGGFTSYSDAQLASQLSRWVNHGIRAVKMKVGTEPDRDPNRVEVARRAIGDGVELFVDANGAYSAKQAIDLARRFSRSHVTWFEEPVSSDHLADLRLVRHAVPVEMEVAAGEYGYNQFYFRRMLASRAVDVLQLDATRCGGFTGFMAGAAIAASFGCPLSAHCAPSLHMHVGCSIPGFRHVEYFHDHTRIEKMLFDGFIPARDGKLAPDRSRPGLGLIFKRRDAEPYAVR